MRHRGTTPRRRVALSFTSTANRVQQIESHRRRSRPHLLQVVDFAGQAETGANVLTGTCAMRLPGRSTNSAISTTRDFAPAYIGGLETAARKRARRAWRMPACCNYPLAAAREGIGQHSMEERQETGVLPRHGAGSAQRWARAAPAPARWNPASHAPTVSGSPCCCAVERWQRAARWRRGPWHRPASASRAHSSRRYRCDRRLSTRRRDHLVPQWFDGEGTCRRSRRFRHFLAGATVRDFQDN